MKVRRLARRLAIGAIVGWLGAWGGERLLDLAVPLPVEAIERLDRSTVVTAADGTWLQVWPTSAGERVLACSWDSLSPPLRDAILVSEDRDFFAHSGVDVAAVLRAIGQNVRAGRVVSGASTLTMQAVRIVEPRSRTLWSKIVEAFRARQLERAIGKRGVLDLWVTQVPMGGTLRGMESAARYWLGKSAAELNVAESAMLVAMVPAPSARAPHRRPELLRARRDALLERMASAGVLSRAEVDAACALPLDAVRHGWPQRAWHLCAAELGALPERAHPALLTTHADFALQQRLEALVAERRELPGDGLAIVVIDRQDAELLAMVAAREARPGCLDLSQCRRSVGSTLKPFLFALAIEHGALCESSLLEDAPLEFDDWHPVNFDGDHAGRTRPADALAVSANLPAVRCLQRVGVESFHQLLAGLGLPADPAGIHLDAALGTTAASPLELARAYQRFVANPESVGLSRRSVDWAIDAMSRLPAGVEQAIAGRVAWKSGTSSGRRDAWCVGLTTDSVVVVWLGNRTGRGEADLVGAHTAVALLGEAASLL